MRNTITGRFTATDPATGKRYEIQIVTPYQSWSDSSGGGTAAGRKDLQTSDGRGVTRDGKGVYRIVADDIELTSDDPNAP